MSQVALTRVLVALSLVFALAALLLPYIPDSLMKPWHQQSAGSGGDGSSKCPLGFGDGSGELPAYHPSIRGRTKHRDDSLGGPGIPPAFRTAAASTPNRLTLFFNATILTWDDQAPLVEAMLVNRTRVAAVGDFAAMATAIRAEVARALRLHDAGGAGSALSSYGADDLRQAVLKALVDGERLRFSRYSVASGAGQGPGSAGRSTVNARGKAGQSMGEAPEESERVEVEVVDLQGRFAMPGFVDPHIHLIPAGLSLSALDLGPSVATKQAFVGAVASAAGRLPPAAGGEGEQRWLTGGGWDEARWGGALPDRSWIDKASGGRAVWLTRMDGHMGLASTEALRLAGIGPGTAPPAGGVIDFGPDGHPTGILREGAMALVSRLVPQPSLGARRAALAAAAAYALARGVTTVGDMGRHPFDPNPSASWDDLQELYMPAADQGLEGLSLRVVSYLPLTTWSRLATYIAVHGTAHAGGRLLWGGVKEFADGSLGSRTALMWRRYSDDAAGAASAGDDGGAGGGTGDASGGDGDEEYGQRVIELERLKSMVNGAARSGLQVAVHAIGDRAVDEVAAVLANNTLFAKPHTHANPNSNSNSNSKGGSSPAASSSSSSSGSGAMARWLIGTQQAHGVPHRVEHAQHASGPRVFERLAAAGVAVVPNPLHLLTDAPALVQQRLGGAGGSAGSGASSITDGASSTDSSSRGGDRAGPGRAYAFGSMIKAGLRPAFGSDWPVVDLQPMAGVYAAVFRHVPPSDAHHQAEVQLQRLVRTLRPNDTSPRWPGGEWLSPAATAALDLAHVGAGGHEDLRELRPWLPQEQIDVLSALRGHTEWAAAALGLQGHAGALRPGMPADMAVLSHSPLGDDDVAVLLSKGEGAAGSSGSGSGRSGSGSGGDMGRDGVSFREALPVVLRTYSSGRCMHSLPDWPCA